MPVRIEIRTSLHIIESCQKMVTDLQESYRSNNQNDIKHSILATLQNIYSQKKRRRNRKE